YTPALAMIGPQRSISAFRWARKASGVARFSSTGSVPRSAKRCLTAGSLSATCSAPTRVSMTGFGVPFGAYMPCHTATSKPGRPAMVPEDGVAVRRRLGGARRTDGAAGAADVFHDDLLFQFGAHGLRQQARHGVGRPARSKRHDHGDWLVRVILGLRQAGAEQ